MTSLRELNAFDQFYCFETANRHMRKLAFNIIKLQMIRDLSRKTCFSESLYQRNRKEFLKWCERSKVEHEGLDLVKTVF